MATIDDLNEQGKIHAVLEDVDTGAEIREEVRIVIRIPIELLNTIASGDTRSRVMVRDWIIPAMEAAP